MSHMFNHFFTDANLLIIKDESLLEKWLMIYLRHHPSYQGKTVDAGTMLQWKKAVLKASEVKIKKKKNHKSW